ncbi:hypothetical protein [Actinacidiphila oryziradicis]|jgi:hypothetical protein|uniref:Sugar kinase n=2 Tax=Actinacidiphila oryziradicis TaxID=2571141 RepID=A0A4U0SPH4_9ACTN|nr:hypothetical protein [Actinacidiphila oryziradicis]TKA11073.1 hypothetical protein FCI23_14065 [Actinacidiphila oryziradicis]
MTSAQPLRKPPRWVRWTVVPLLVLAPVGYVIISAEQSRDSGIDKQNQAAATRLTHYWPSKVQRRIYQVPIPLGGVASGVAYLETNSWTTSTLYVQFRTNAGALDSFLAQLGTSRAALKTGDITITAQQRKMVRWNFRPAHQWAGASLTEHGDKPDHNLVVDLTNPDLPVIYVASTMNF